MHRDEEYPQEAFDMLLKMQDEHFWYRGRHAFLRAALGQVVPKASAHRSAIDLGGGCGGWIAYLNKYEEHLFSELALGDSSLRALEMAERVVSPNTSRFQIDLRNLGWQSRWDVIFLLDVLEHITDDGQVLRQIYQALRPGGVLIMTTPALKIFWSQNDERVGHHRRYSKTDFRALAQGCALEEVMIRYFMFLLSPLYLLSRLGERFRSYGHSEEDFTTYFKRTHAIPAQPINSICTAIFELEAKMGLTLPFPWGTSILGVFRKPL